MRRSAPIFTVPLLLLAAACSKQEPEPTDPAAGMTRSPAAAATGAGAGAAVDADEAAILDVVMTPEEAAARAAREIDADNAEQMLEEIRKEVGGGR